MKQDTKRIPYGRNDFVQIIEQNNYYVDKTMYLPALEDEAVTSSLSVLAVLARAYSSVCSKLIMIVT